MLDDDDALFELAGQVADGSAVDWRLMEASAATAELAERVRTLERLAKIGAFHAASGVPPINDLHESILHPAGSLPTLSDSPDPVEWGPLTVISKIGRGTFGDVYRARERRLDREVALKLIRRKGSDDDDGSHVIEEARLIAKVRHPNIIAVYGADRIDGRVGLWMEFVDGRTLEEELQDRGPFSAAELTRVGSDMAAALAAVHHAGLLHRDVKAQNVMRSVDGRLLLTDFGTGLPADKDPAQESVLAGSPLYLAPEVLAGESATVSSDLYSLGVLLYHLATGSFPVRGKTMHELREAHERQEGVSLAKVAPQLSVKLHRLIESLLARDPERRLSSASDLATALEVVKPGPLGRRLMLIASVTIVLTGALVVLAQMKNAGGQAVELSGLASRPVHEVTTTSERARELYSQAAALMHQDPRFDDEGAERLLTEALTHDPKFASGRILLAWTFANRIPALWSAQKFPREPDARIDRMLNEAGEAERLSAGTSAVEQYFIAGSHHEMRAMAAGSAAEQRNEYQAARVAYESLMRVAPNHYWTLNNLNNTYGRLGLFSEQLEIAVPLSDVRPNRFAPAWKACQFLLRHDDPARAALYADRAAQAVDRNRQSSWPEAMLRMFPPNAAWLRGDIAGAAKLTDAVAASLNQLPDGPARDDLAMLVVKMNVTLGRLAAADLVSLTFNRKAGRALVLAARAQPAALAEYLGKTYAKPAQRVQPHVQVLFVPAGLITQAKETLTAETAEMAPWMLTVRGQVALAEGHPAEAVSWLERAVGARPEGGLYSRYAETVLALDTLASALRATGSPEKAISTILSGLGRRGETVMNGISGYAWIAARANLADLYRESGRLSEASAVEAELLSLLAVADNDFPLLKRLKAPGRSR